MSSDCSLQGHRVRGEGQFRCASKNVPLGDAAARGRPRRTAAGLSALVQSWSRRHDWVDGVQPVCHVFAGLRIRVGRKATVEVNPASGVALAAVDRVSS